MGSTRDFLTATIADAITPSFKRPVEDIIYETLDRRQTPSRTDFKELRDGLNSLNAQYSSLGNGVKKLKEGLDDLEESSHNNETEIIDLKNLVQDLQDENAALKETVNILMGKVLLLEAGQTNQAKNSARNEKTNSVAKKNSAKITKEAASEASKGSKTCKHSDCKELQRASGFCGPHYGRWRRGTLDGFVDYEGNIKQGDKIISVGKKLRGKEFSIRENQIWIDGVSVATL